MEHLKNLKLYVLMSKDGLFYRSVGYGGSGPSWTEDFEKAKIYGKLSAARSQVTWWSKHYMKDFGIPDLIEISISPANFKIMDEEVERVTKVLEKQKKMAEELEVLRRKGELEKAQKALEYAEKELELLRAKQ